MYASIGNKNFFIKSCHCQAYQNYEQPPKTCQNSYFQSHFSLLKIGQIFPKKFYEEYWTRTPTLIKNVYENLIVQVLYFFKLCPIFVGSVRNFGRSDDDRI